AADAVPSLAGNPLDDAARMYRSIPGVRLSELRDKVGEDGMLPHEAVYWSRVVTPPEDGGFASPEDTRVLMAEERRRIFQRLIDLPPSQWGRVEYVDRWLRENGMTPRQVVERLSPAHFVALMAYTSPAYKVMNGMLKNTGGSSRAALRIAVRAFIDRLLGEEEYRNAQDTLAKVLAVLKDGPDLDRLFSTPLAETTAEERARLRERLQDAAEKLVPHYEQEIPLHTAMLLDALSLLPPALGEAWRAKSYLELSFASFTSFSRSRREAEYFLGSFAEQPKTHPVLMQGKLRGNQGRDISAFSTNPREQEVLLLPGSRMEISSRRIVPNEDTYGYGYEIKEYELIEAVEEAPEFPVLDLGATAVEAQIQAAGLRDALQRLPGSGPVVTRGDLQPLARRTGAADGLQVWRLAGLASEIHGGTEHLTVEALATVRRTADLARRVLNLDADQPVTGEHLNALVRRLDRAAPDTPVEPDARIRLLNLVAALQTPGPVTYAHLADRWQTPDARQPVQPSRGAAQGDARELMYPVTDPLRPEQRPHQLADAPGDARTSKVPPRSAQGVPPEVRRFAEQQFGKLDEPTAGQLWAEASRITAEHHLFPLTVAEGARGLLERDPEQYWATMRVAHVLHQYADTPDRLDRATAAARDLAAQRGAGTGSAREGLLGGVAARMAEAVRETPLVRETGVVEAPEARQARDSRVPQADSLKTFLAKLEGTSTSAEVPSPHAVAGAVGVAPVADLVPDASLAPATDRGLRALYADKTYAPTAREFEKRLGAYAFRQPRALEAVRQGVARLFDVLAQAHPDLSEDEIAKVFFAGDLTSAGQIGADHGLSALQELLQRGSVRELMTAFFNAAIENRSPLTLRSLLHAIADSGDWAKAERLGLDVRSLRDQDAYLGSDLRARLRAAVERVAPDKAAMFDKDFFGLGNLAAQAPSWKQEAAKYWGDQYFRHRLPRPEADRLKGDNAATPSEWARLRVGLSEREVAFLAANQGALQVLGFRTEKVPLEQVPFDEQGAPLLDELRAAPGVLGVEVHYDAPEGTKGRTVTGITRIVEEPTAVEKPRAGDLARGEQGPELPMSSVSGKARFTLDESSELFREMHGRRGMLMTAGVSGTAARIGNAFKLLHVPGLDAEGLTLALIGWMLPLQDHSLYEILAGLQTAHVVPSLAANPLDDATRMYRSVPGVSSVELRDRVAVDGMLPHEATYWSKFFTPVEDGGFTGLEAFGLQLVQEHRSDFERLIDQPLPDDPDQDGWAEDWLRLNGMTSRQLLERLTPAHFAALATYSSATYQLINPLIKSDPIEAGSALRSQVEWLVEEHLRDGSGLPPALRDQPEFAALTTVSPRGMDREQLEQHRARFQAVVERLLPVVEREMAAHAAMLLDALEQLPPATGEVWRGTRLVGYEGTELSFDKFASFSRDREAAADTFLFARKAPLQGSHRVLLRAELSGNAGRDISAFSLNEDEQEVLLLPTARLNITSREVREGDGRRAYELVEAVEEPPELPHGALRNALQQIAGYGSVVKHDDLLPLAGRIGVADGRQVWHLGPLAGEVYGGPEHLTLERLTDVRRTADLARGLLRVGPDRQIAGTHLDALVRRLDGLGAITPVDEGARARLVALVRRLETSGQQVTYTRLADAWQRTVADAQGQEGRAGESPDYAGDLSALPDLKRFVAALGKLDEQAAGELWREAARITAEHNPFDLTVAEGAGSLLERDSQQYWATLRVAQVLHEFAGRADRLDRAVETARELAARRGVSAVRERLLGGSPDVVVGESSGSGATTESDVPMSEAASVPDGSEVFRERPGSLSVLYTDPAYVPLAQAFEQRLAEYASSHPRALKMAQVTASVLFEVLSEAHPDRDEEEIVQVFRPADQMAADQDQAAGWPTDLFELLSLGLPDVMAAVHHAALASDSPLALPALLRGITSSGDWAKAQELGLDVPALREGATAAPPTERASRTAAELGHLLSVLNLSREDGEGFALALMGWLLPRGEESLYEVLAGLRTAGVVPALAGNALEDAARMYRSIPGLELKEVRDEIAADGLLPHEAVYWSKVQDGTFAEPAESMLRQAMRRRQEFAELVTDPMGDLALSDIEDEPSVERWLLMHDAAPEKVLERLSLPHFVALMVYTGTASALINTVLKFGPAEVRPELRKRLRRTIDERFGKPLTNITSVLTGDPVAGAILADRHDLTEEANARYTEELYTVAERLLPAVEREMAAHAAMLLEALEQLPPATGEVWRGKRSVRELFAGTGHGDPAESGRLEFSFPAFASFSRDEDVARDFMRHNLLPGERPVLVLAQLSGHWGRDITAFSAQDEEDEVLLLPGARLKIEARSPDTDDEVGDYELIEAREVAPPSAELQRFAKTFGKLDEPTAGQLWAEASRITAEHNPFDLTVTEGRGSLLERDSEQYWATMRVAQELHESAGDADPTPRAVAVAKALAAERGVSASRSGLRGGATDTTSQSRPPRVVPETASAEGAGTSAGRSSGPTRRGSVAEDQDIARPGTGHGDRNDTESGQPRTQTSEQSQREATVEAPSAEARREQPAEPVASGGVAEEVREFPQAESGARQRAVWRPGLPTVSEQLPMVPEFRLVVPSPEVVARYELLNLPVLPEVVGRDMRPVPGWTVTSRADGGYTVAQTSGDVRWHHSEDLLPQALDVRLAGTAHFLRTAVGEGGRVVSVVGEDGTAADGYQVQEARDESGALTGVSVGAPGDELGWHFDGNGVPRDVEVPLTGNLDGHLAGARIRLRRVLGSDGAPAGVAAELDADDPWVSASHGVQRRPDGRLVLTDHVTGDELRFRRDGSLVSVRRGGETPLRRRLRQVGERLFPSLTPLVEPENELGTVGVEYEPELARIFEETLPKSAASGAVRRALDPRLLPLIVADSTEILARSQMDGFTHPDGLAELRAAVHEQVWADARRALEEMEASGAASGTHDGFTVSPVEVDGGRQVVHEATGLTTIFGPPREGLPREVLSHEVYLHEAPPELAGVRVQVAHDPHDGSFVGFGLVDNPESRFISDAPDDEPEEDGNPRARFVIHDTLTGKRYVFGAEGTPAEDPRPQELAAPAADDAPFDIERAEQMQLAHGGPAVGGDQALRPLYADAAYLPKVKEFEERLATFAAGHPRAVAAARQGVSRLFEVLSQAHPERSAQEIWRNFRDDGASGPQELLERGDVRELMTALSNAVSAEDSPFTSESPLLGRPVPTAGSLSGRGIPLATGVSETAAQIGHAFKALVPDGDADGLSLSLLGWLLPTRGHSVYEVLAGLQAADAVPSLAGNPLDDAARMYRSIPGVRLS
ncbi:hypothetical protein H8R17_42935, partial [Streptomyces sp. TRM68367]|nr:hypothetical protein [Streptomyces sp. TRM68367]